MRRLVANPDRSLHLTLWGIVGIVFVWSFIGCRDLLTWFMEVLPVLIGSVILYSIYDRWRFTRLVCWLLFFHAILLMVGAHYTYAHVPLFNWIRDTFDLNRNNYDRLGHFTQGFVPAMVAREILLRNNVLKRGPWLIYIVLSICLAFSACYEFTEWIAAVTMGGSAEAFLSTQGDIWDTQWDMALALVGAAVSLALLSRFHDRQLKTLESTIKTGK